jgi:hypothetical protein
LAKIDQNKVMQIKKLKKSNKNTTSLTGARELLEFELEGTQ